MAPNPRPSDYVKCSPVRILDRLDIAYADPQAKLDDVIVRRFYNRFFTALTSPTVVPFLSIAKKECLPLTPKEL
jgi:hypothetical protein